MWLGYWIVSARGAKANALRESGPSLWLHFGLMIAGAVVLTFPSLLPPEYNMRRFTEYESVYWLSAALVAVGLGFACYARAEIGSNWSAAVTVKQEHQLITSGPFGYVRHPIYTGILVALFGTALETGAWRGVIGFVLIASAIIYKYRIEERFLVGQFGDDYLRYRTRVPALVPFLSIADKSRP